MNKKQFPVFLIVLCVVFAFGACNQEGNTPNTTARTTDYEDLLVLFREFREFVKPPVVDGVPDYSPEAMAAQHKGLNEFQERLAAIDISEWPISQKVDYHILRAEMNGLDFDHRVMRPWSRDPAFYLKSQSGAGPSYYGGVRLRELPLSEEGVAETRVKLQAVPAIYKNAKACLTEASGDLAAFAIHFLGEELAMYRGIADAVAESHPELVPDVERAKAAVKDYGRWLEENKDRMTEHPGLGVENYNWWMKNVQLVPYTWEELMTIMLHEYDRALSALKLEQLRNSHLPPLKAAASEEEYNSLYYECQKHLWDFLQKKEMFTIPDYLEPYPPKPWANFPARQGGEVRDFFEQCEDRNPLPSPLIHEFLGHRFDGLRSRRDDRPIRGEDRLYTIDMIRSEGLAFGMEEMFMHAGLFDKYPRAREINHIMMAFRSVRALADLRLHSQEFGLEDSFKFCYEETPYHWMLPDGYEVWYEMETTLRFPGWHMGMVLGKFQLFSLLADRQKQLGENFKMKEFMDEFFAAGMIPISLIRLEMTGQTDEMEWLIK
jgi:hypothetical protein